MPAVIDPAVLGEMSLFRDLTSAQLVKVSEGLQYKRFQAGVNIITVDQANEIVYFVRTGTVKVHVEQADGTDVILAILGPNEIIGDMSVVDGERPIATVVTMEETTLHWISGATFREFLRTIPMLSYNLVRVLSRRLRHADEQIQSFARLDVYGRVAHKILVFAQQYGKLTDEGKMLIPLRLTQSDLADLVGASRVRVNRALVAFKDHGYISTNSRYHIIVHNPSALAKRCQDVVFEA